jgi:nucleotide-binding universal stress UspA family protein
MRVLVATDGSEPAVIGCELARDVTTRSGGLIRFVAVLPPTAELFGGPWPVAAALDPEVVEREAIEQLRSVLRAEVDRTPPEIQPTSVLRRGSAAREIVAAAVDWSADVIVVGSRGHNALATLLLGSVAEEVVDRSPVPVLVARLPRLVRMVVGVDGSAAADAAVDFVTAHLPGSGLEAIVVDVAPPAYPWWLGLGAADAGTYEQVLEASEAVRQDERVGAEAAVHRFDDGGFSVRGEHRAGDAADELVRAADGFGADTIVIGSRGQRGVVRMVVGSVARQVLRHAPQSVLVVHPVAATVSTNPAAPAEPAHDRTPARDEEQQTAMRILLAYDGSEPARRALERAASIAKVLGGAVDVVSVVPFQGGRAPIAPWDDREVHDAELLDAKARLEALGLSSRVFEPVGDPAHEIERIAADGRYEMVVVGSRSLGLAGRVLQGSVSEHVATHTDATVVVVR